MNSIEEKARLDAQRSHFLQGMSEFLPAKSTGVEIGVRKGHFSHLLLRNLSLKKLYLVDPWEVGADKNGITPDYGGDLKLPTAYSTNEDLQGVEKLFCQEIKEGKVVIWKGFSYDVIPAFPNDYFDFMYIDACHLYECVKADIQDCLPKLRPSGLLCGHDYTPNPHFGVIKAVDEFLETNKQFKWKLRSPEGDWALQRQT